MVQCQYDSDSDQSDSDQSGSDQSDDQDDQDYQALEKKPHRSSAVPPYVPPPAPASPPVIAPVAPPVTPPVSPATPNLMAMRTKVTGLFEDGAKMWTDFWSCMWGR